MQEQQSRQQQFVQYYSSLSQMNESQEANRLLMELEQSDEAWQTAKNLIANYPQYRQYGLQLLSKKLNRPYSQNMEHQVNLATFLGNLTRQGEVVGIRTVNYCIAKLVLQLNWNIDAIVDLNNPKAMLSILSEIPNAASVICILPTPTPDSQPDSQRNRCTKVLHRYLPYLQHQFLNFPNLTLSCIESFVTNNYKIQSQTILLQILKLPLSETCTCLEELLLQQNLPSHLYGPVWGYLQTQQGQAQRQEDGEFFGVFFAFVRAVRIRELLPNQLNSLLEKVLKMVSRENTLSAEQKAECHYITDSLELWIDISKVINAGRGRRHDEEEGEGQMQIYGQELIQGENENHEQLMEICRNAFAKLWSIVVQRCLLEEMPVFKGSEQIPKQQILIDSDEENGYTVLNPQAPVTPTQKFRQTGQQFLQIIFQTLQKSPTHLTQILNLIFCLSKSQSPLELELSIFAVSCIIDTVTSSTLAGMSEILLQIVHNQHIKSAYLWQQLILLMGKFTTQIVCCLQIFQVVIAIVKESVMVPELCVTVSQSFNQILTTCSTSVQRQQQGKILDVLFRDVLFAVALGTNNLQLMNQLVKSVVLYTYYFVESVELLAQFLEGMKTRARDMAERGQNCEVVELGETIALAHLFVRDECSEKFASTISQFLVNFLVIIERIAAQASAIHLESVFNQFGIMVTAGAGFNTCDWIQATMRIANLPNMQQHQHLPVQVFNKLLAPKQKDAEAFSKAITGSLPQIQPYITNLLLQRCPANTKIAPKALAFHQTLLTKIYLSPISSPYWQPLMDWIVRNVLRGDAKFDYQTSRVALGILIQLCQRGLYLHLILPEVLRAYPRLSDYLWKSLEAVFSQAYVRGGRDLYVRAFQKVYPAILPPNPLFEHLIEAIRLGRSKDYRNLLSQLK